MIVVRVFLYGLVKRRRLMRRGLVLVLTLGAVALSDTPAAVRFIHPRAQIVLTGPRGTTLPYQAHVLRHADNRWVQLEVWDGETRIQSSGWSIDGLEAAAIQPTMRPLSVAVGPGRYTFRALACVSVTDASECERIRASASMVVLVCGGDVDGCQ